MIADDLLAALPRLQEAAESLMVSPCTIRRPSSVEPDPVTGADTEVPGALVYDGGCKLQSREGEIRNGEVADSTTTTQRWEVHVPVSSGPYLKGDVVTVLGRKFRVEGLHVKTWQTAQRLPVVEVL